MAGFSRLATKIRERKAATEGSGPVLVLDAGDFTMGTAFAAATSRDGGRTRLLAMLGYDATTFGNHDFNLGPYGTAAAIGAAVEAGQVPVILATNTDFGAPAPAIAGLQTALGAKGGFATILSLNAAESGSAFLVSWGAKRRPTASARLLSPLPIRLRRHGRWCREAAGYRESRCGDRAQPGGVFGTRTAPLPTERMCCLPPKCPG